MTKADGPRPLGGFADHEPCCSVRSFKENKCKVALPRSAGTWICLSGTSYQSAHSFHDKLCDLLFAWERIPSAKVSAPLELKGGSFNVSEVQRQLQSGADIIDGLLKGIQVAFLPVLVHQTIPPIERKMFNNSPVSFRGRKFKIFTLKSPGRLDTLRW